MNLYIPTTVSGSVTAGAYKDNAKTTIINAYGVDLSSTPKNSTVNIGGVQLTKTDGTSAITSSPATFVLVRAKDATAAETLVKKHAASFNGSSSDLSSLPTAYSSTDNASFVTQADGTIAVKTTGASGWQPFLVLTLLTPTQTQKTQATILPSK